MPVSMTTSLYLLDRQYVGIKWHEPLHTPLSLPDCYEPTNPSSVLYWTVMLFHWQKSVTQC